MHKADIQFAYHNHSFEFQKVEGLDKLPLDYLLTNTDPKLVKVELDLCWITVGGQDPIAYFNKYPGRFPLVHVKDWVKEGSTPDGNMGAVGHKVEGHMTNVGRALSTGKTSSRIPGKPVSNTTSSKMMTPSRSTIRRPATSTCRSFGFSRRRTDCMVGQGCVICGTLHCLELVPATAAKYLRE